MEETWTILKVLQWTAGYFSRKGIEQPRANAEVLLAHVLGTERLQLYLRFDQPLSSEELSRYREVVRRRATHEPTQYITRKQEFWSLEFEVTPSVLVPRPETELLVERALEIISQKVGLTVLDLGTGSGAIAISLAHECPSARIVATDRSYDALRVARRNAIRHEVQGSILFAAVDLLSAFAPSHMSFHIILSNPPYIGDGAFAQLAPEVACFEPQEALRGGGPEGLDVIRRILQEAPKHLKPGGSLCMEIGQGQEEVLGPEIKKDPRIQQYEFHKDYAGIPRVIQLRTVNR